MSYKQDNLTHEKVAQTALRGRIETAVIDCGANQAIIDPGWTIFNKHNEFISKKHILWGS
jgi:hypothetical protein